jgi:hypothetical protein
METNMENENPTIEGVAEKDLDNFLIRIIDEEIKECRRIMRTFYSDDLSQKILGPMKDIFFRDKKDNQLTLKERLGQFVEEIAKQRGEELYGGENKNIRLFSNLLGKGDPKTLDFLEEEEKKAYSENSIFYGNESNFMLFWRILERFGQATYLEHRKELLDKGEIFEPRWPGAKLAESLEGIQEDLDGLKKLKGLKELKQSDGNVENTNSDIGNIDDMSKADLSWWWLGSLYEKLETGEKIYWGELQNIRNLWKLGNPSGEAMEYFGAESAHISEDTRNSKATKYFGDKDYDLTLISENTRNKVKKFIEAFCSYSAVQKKLGDAINDKEEMKKNLETIKEKEGEGEYLRPIPKDPDIIYRVYGGWEQPKTGHVLNDNDNAVIKKIYEKRGEYPIGDYIQKNIDTGGTNMTSDCIFSGVFTYKAKGDAFIVTDGAIPVDNIAGKYEINEALNNAHKELEKKKRFGKNNPVVPLTKKESQTANVNKSTVILVTGEFMLDKYEKRLKNKELENNKAKEEFVTGLYIDLLRESESLCNDEAKLDELDKNLESLREKQKDNEKTAEISKMHKFDSKKKKYLEELYKENMGKYGEIEKKNEIILKLQEKRILENSSIAVKNANNELSNELSNELEKEENKNKANLIPAFQGKTKTKTESNFSLDDSIGRNDNNLLPNVAKTSEIGSRLNQQ